LPSQTLNLSNKTIDKTFTFKFNNNNFQGGKCFISVLVSDGELETKKYLEIHINESPKIFTGFITSELVGSNANLNFFNNSGIQQGSYFFEGNFSGGIFFSSEQTIVGFANSSMAQAIKLPSIDKVWQYNAAQVKNMTFNENQFFLLKDDGYTSGFNVSDFSSYQSYYEPTLTYLPVCAAAENNMICVFQNLSNLSAQKKIIVYDIITSNIIKELNTQNTVKMLISVNNNEFVTHHISNSNQHQIGLYNFMNNTINTIYISNTNIKSISKLDNNTIFVLNNSGIGLFNIQTNNFQMLIAKTNIVSFEYNIIDNEIYLICDNLVERYSLTGDFISSLSLTYQPNFICLTYNK
jgi:hypothetical protein